MLPRVHGSGLFTRGETQVLTSLALGTTKEAQRIDGLGIETTKRYIHHYNFPPFSVGETGFMRGPKRRDIGHGALAERALLPMIPDDVEFPYTLRLVSETLESNGSSSMASVCGSTLALLDAGVPITRPVAGIAMGLIKEGDDYIVLSDIQGDEDHLGDMDFKVAGTANGINALQMDIKITGVTFEILQDALAQAKAGREHILGIMAETLAEPRTELSAWAPRITAIKIDPERIGTVIGKGGETIRGLEADYEVEISIEDDGTVKVYGVNGEKADAAIEQIRAMTKDVEVGDTYTGAKVVKTTTFGAFVELTKGVDGLLHISNLGRGRVDKVEDVVNRGDTVDVTVVEVDKARGRIGLRIVGMEDADGGGNGGRGLRGRGRRRAAAPPPAPADRRRVVSTTPAGIAPPVLGVTTGGLRVISETLPGVRSVAIGIWIGVGSRFERVEEAGISHFLEHMLFKGTPSHSAEQIAQAFDGLGGEVNAATGKDYTVLYARVLDELLDRAFPLLTDMLQRPAFVRARAGARGGPRGDRDVRGRPPGPDPRPGEQRRLPRPGARPAR